MVRIYIQNSNLSDIKNKLNILKPFLIKEKEEIHLFSKDYGHYKISDKIYLLEPVYIETYEQKKYQDHLLLINSNKEETISIVSQLPVEYIYNKRNYFEYKLSKTSSLVLVIWGSYEIPKQEQEFFKKKIDSINIFPDFYPLDFYFEYDEKKFDLENQFFQEEFNRFLLMLN